VQSIIVRTVTRDQAEGLQWWQPRGFTVGCQVKGTTSELVLP
jgi:hypothetical protein